LSAGEVRIVVHAATPGDGRPGHLRAVGRPAPVAGHGEAVVEVHAALLRPGAAAPPVDGTVVGTEAAGVVVEVGPGVAGLAVGDGVTLPALLTCGRCPACQAGRANLCPQRQRPGSDVDGWLAERVAVPAHLLISTAAAVPAALAASVPGTAAIAYHALKRAGVGPGLTVAVVGADALGLHLTQLAALAGADVTTLDDRPDARERAEDLGADAALPLDGRSLVDVLGAPVDRLIARGPHPQAPTTAVAALAPGGRLVVLDADDVAGEAPIPTQLLARHELDVVGSSGATPQDAVELLDLAAEGRLVLTTAIGGRFGIGELDLAESALEGNEDGLLVAVDPRS
jgi:D-arabinose 1-dehydrogenase-like Zn-dependent alcohol dehydrogenase